MDVCEDDQKSRMSVYWRESVTVESWRYLEVSVGFGLSYLTL
jgi:hypothetical protein